MSQRGFVPVNKFVKMWQMWLIVFIKREYQDSVTKVRSSSIAKGVGNVIGNKGGVAHSFMI